MCVNLVYFIEFPEIDEIFNNILPYLRKWDTNSLHRAFIFCKIIDCGLQRVDPQNIKKKSILNHTKLTGRKVWKKNAHQQQG